jgi:hypothetical protein
MSQIFLVSLMIYRLIIRNPDFEYGTLDSCELIVLIFNYIKLIMHFSISL